MSPVLLIELLALIAAAGIAGRASLAAQRRRVRQAWARVDAALCERAAGVRALIVAAPDGLLPELDAASRRALAARGVPERAEAENRLSMTLRDRAISDFAPSTARLLQEITGPASRTFTAQQEYNRQVMAWNQRIHRLPWRLVARGFRPAEYLVLDAPAPAPASERVRADAAPG